MKNFTYFITGVLNEIYFLKVVPEKEKSLSLFDFLF
jgi:hypothetical protein